MRISLPVLGSLEGACPGMSRSRRVLTGLSLATALVPAGFSEKVYVGSAGAR